MDHVLCDYDTQYKKYKDQFPHYKYPQACQPFWTHMMPLKGAIHAFKQLKEEFDVYILTRPSIYNPVSYSGKRIWVEKWLGFDMCEKLILSPNKGLIGDQHDILIDDQAFGPGQQEHFNGELIHFGSERFPGWAEVLRYLIPPEEELVDVQDGMYIKVIPCTLPEGMEYDMSVQWWGLFPK